MDDQSARDDLESIDAIHPDDLKEMPLKQYEKIRDPRRGGLRAGLRVSIDAPRLSQRPKEKLHVEEWLKMPLTEFERVKQRRERGEVEIITSEEG